MTQERWVKTAMTDQSLVAAVLLRMKHSLDSNSLHSPPSQQKTAQTSISIFPPRWGNRKNRSKSTALATGGKEHRGSPTTHLSWSGGSTSDESSRLSHLRSVKAHEIASTSSCNNKSHKRKAFLEHKDEEVSLIKQRSHINKESTSTSMRVNLNQQMSTSQNLKKIKINYGQTTRNKTMTRCRLEAEMEPQKRGFVLPDLNMTPNDEDLTMMVS